MRAAIYKGQKKFTIEERSEPVPSNDEVRLKIAFVVFVAPICMFFME